MIDENLAQLSDLAFEATMAGYLVALVCHAVEAASRRTRAPERVPVGAGAGAGSGGGGAGAGVGAGRSGSADAGDTGRVDRQGQAPERRHTSLGEQVGRAAVIVTVLGFVGHITAIVLRGLAAGRPPWGNMYEFTLMITAGAIAAWLFVLWRNPTYRAMGIYVMTPILVLIFLAGTVLYTRTGPIEPILNTFWLQVHVVTMSLSAGVLMLSGLASAAYLARLRYDARVADGGLPPGRIVTKLRTMVGLRSATRTGTTTKLPAADKLDRVAYRAAITAFPFYTFAVIAGAMWAEVAWGKYWSWDPKEVVALVSWVVYAGYLHARATAGWRGKPAAWIAIVGLGTIIFNLFFVNMVISGMHSYAGLN